MVNRHLSMDENFCCIPSLCCHLCVEVIFVCTCSLCSYNCRLQIALALCAIKTGFLLTSLRLLILNFIAFIHFCSCNFFFYSTLTLWFCGVMSTPVNLRSRGPRYDSQSFRCQVTTGQIVHIRVSLSPSRYNLVQA